jgi:hypothetical protein
MTLEQQLEELKRQNEQLRDERRKLADTAWQRLQRINDLIEEIKFLKKQLEQFI